MNDRAYSIEQIAERWNCSKTSVRRLIRDGKLLAFAVNGKQSAKPRWRVLHDDLRSFEEDNRQQAAPVQRRTRKKVEKYRRFI